MPPRALPFLPSNLLFCVSVNQVMFLTLPRGSKRPSVGKQEVSSVHQIQMLRKWGTRRGLQVELLSHKAVPCVREAPGHPHCLPACLTPNIPGNNSTSYLRYGPASLNHQLLDCTTHRLYKRILRKNKIYEPHITASVQVSPPALRKAQLGQLVHL